MTTENSERRLPNTEEAKRLASEPTNVEQLAGTVLLERYRLLELRGVGGASAVYRATHTLMGKDLAVKVLRPELAIRQDFVQRFLAEARAVARLRHEHIVDVVDIGRTEHGVVFCVMELLEGEELACTVERERRLPWSRACHIVLQVFDALAAAHRAGIVHRDIKPANCFRVRRAGNPDFIKLLDFGIAKDIDHDRGLTSTGIVMGTAEYMSPEQARGQPVDKRSDIYSAGVLLFELVSGRVPFEGDSFLDVAMQHATDPVPPLAAKVPGLPPGLDTLLARAMAKSAGDRFATIEEFAGAVRELSGAAPQLQNGLLAEYNGSEAAVPVPKPVSLRDVTGKLYLPVRQRGTPPRW